jgi:hypothetical protein
MLFSAGFAEVLKKLALCPSIAKFNRLFFKSLFLFIAIIAK